MADKVSNQVGSPRSSKQWIVSLLLAGPAKSKSCLFGMIGRDNRWKKSKEKVGFQEAGISATSVRRILLNKHYGKSYYNNPRIN